MDWNRREFLAAAALATGAVVLASAPTTRRIVSLTQAVDPVATDVYFERKYGIQQSTIDRCLRALLATGGQWGELFFEHSRSVSVSLSDGLVSRAFTNRQLGMGVRCTVDDQVGFAYTESLLPDDMLRAAKAAAGIAQGADVGVVSARKWLDFQRHYDQEINLDTISVADVVVFLRSVEAKTLATDDHIIKVELSLN